MLIVRGACGSPFLAVLSLGLNFPAVGCRYRAKARGREAIVNRTRTPHIPMFNKPAICSFVGPLVGRGVYARATWAEVGPLEVFVEAREGDMSSTGCVRVERRYMGVKLDGETEWIKPNERCSSRSDRAGDGGNDRGGG